MFCIECRENSVRSVRYNWMNAQKRQAIIVKNADDASKKEKKMPLFRRKIERRHEKETMRAAEKMRRTAAWKSTAKDNFSGGKKSF